MVLSNTAAPALLHVTKSSTKMNLLVKVCFFIPKGKNVGGLFFLLIH